MAPLPKSTLTSWRIFSACLRLRSSLSSEMMDKKATWDRLYAESSTKASTFKTFEWFFGFEAAQNFIVPLLRTAARPEAALQVLDVGCGTSALGPSLYQRCPTPVRVTCGDISAAAVRLMREHVRAEAVRPGNGCSRLAFVELDCTQLHRHFAPGSVDLIVDKGTTDALLKSKDGKRNAGLALGQCLKALRHSGSLLQFCDEDPDARLLWLETEAPAARVHVQEVGELRGVFYYCYRVTPVPNPRH
ncbi:citrate synthase-lysine N-methyltransferase CSKMT, mitochondrial [Syngnathoides biaculeatus]|uniref:citrate synthase-lysine N-methyltransferase CSKMT, mitochondrial n=1 Tax=Syngnathoides biaculeatus TaxID=300417 RepID=UPI002ADDFA84|nr:citrate synthase-lysine N-methyltransferase CSKMT, mitochondrial [Syngnathoides biaculeatus]